MTLRRQLLFIIIALFVLLFVGTFAINIHNTRAYLNDQLRAISQDMATSLGLTLSPYMADNDMIVVESHVSALYDSGYYREIIISDTGGQPLIERIQQRKVEHVPNWFVQMFPLKTPVGESLIMNGWTQAGSIQISANPEFAYSRLWSSTVYSFFWFFGSFIFLFGLCVIALHYVLRPLRAVEKQAEAISNKDYVIQTKLPWTLELRSVVAAMNEMSSRIRIIFSEQEATLERIRDAAYTDTITGLANRSYFTMRLNYLIESHGDFEQGALLFLEISNLQQINQQAGQQAGDALLRGVTELIRAELKHGVGSEAFAARLSGSTFAIAIAGISETLAWEFAQNLSRQLPELQKQGLTDSEQIGHIGMSLYRGQGFQKLMAEVDMSLRAAQITGNNAVHYHKTHVSSEFDSLTATQWINLLRRVVDEQKSILLLQSVMDIQDHVTPIQHEVLLRITNDDGKLIPAGIFIPMVHHHGFTIEIDKMVIREVLGRLESSESPSGSIVINLAPTSIRDPGFVVWVVTQLMAQRKLASRIVFEISDYAATQNLPAVQNWIHQLMPTGARTGIDHFGRSFTSFNELGSLNLSHLKIDGSFIRGIHENKDNQQFVGTLVNIAHSHDIMVIAESIETEEELKMVETLRVDAVQGYALHKPETWEKQQKQQ